MAKGVQAARLTSPGSRLGQHMPGGGTKLPFSFPADGRKGFLIFDIRLDSRGLPPAWYWFPLPGASASKGSPAAGWMSACVRACGSPSFLSDLRLSNLLCEHSIVSLFMRLRAPYQRPIHSHLLIANFDPNCTCRACRRGPVVEIPKRAELHSTLASRE